VPVVDSEQSEGNVGGALCAATGFSGRKDFNICATGASACGADKQDAQDKKKSVGRMQRVFHTRCALKYAHALNFRASLKSRRS
jgi:hypothetical protein